MQLAYRELMDLLTCIEIEQCENHGWNNWVHLWQQNIGVKLLPVTSLLIKALENSHAASLCSLMGPPSSSRASVWDHKSQVRSLCRSGLTFQSREHQKQQQICIDVISVRLIFFFLLWNENSRVAIGITLGTTTLQTEFNWLEIYSTVGLDKFHKHWLFNSKR